MKRKEYTAEDFSWATWGPDDIRALVPPLLEAKKQALEAIKAIPHENRTFENTIYALEASDYPMSPIGRIEFLLNVSPSEAVREAAKEMVNLFSERIVDIIYDKGIYDACVAYEARHEHLEGPDRILLEDTMRGLRRMGFMLPEIKQQRLKEVVKELAKCSLEFSKHINDWHDYILVTDEELDGLPSSYKDHLERDTDGRYKITLEYPDLVPFMKHARNEEKRKELSLKNLQKGGAENMAILSRVLSLRAEEAELLGYKNHAAYQLEERMAKTPETVQGFLGDLLRRVQPAADKDLTLFQEMKRTSSGNTDAILMQHDLSYYLTKSEENMYDIDHEALRAYFPLEKVKRGMFEIYETLFSLSITALPDAERWHESVECYEVRNTDNSIVGYFYLDLYPRKNKYGHAAVFPLVHGHREGDMYVTPVAGMAANFPAPREDNPSLLSHDEVTTFFHEFGHVMHSILTTSAYASQSGTSVAWDFVEAPSQMLEYWMWEPETLRMVSEHYKTKEPIPPNVLERLIHSRKHGIGYLTMRQLIFATYDFAIHTNNDDAKRPNETYISLVKKHLHIDIPSESMFPAGFGHLMGYSAGYYSYLWAKVYASDMFTRFKKEGVLNDHVGKEYRSWILEKGSSEEELNLVKGFLKRDPNNDAFIAEITSTV